MDVNEVLSLDSWKLEWYEILTTQIHKNEEMSYYCEIFLLILNYFS